MTDCNCIDCQYGKPDATRAVKHEEKPAVNKVMNKFKVTSIGIGDCEVTVVGIVRKQVNGCFKDVGPGCILTFDKCSPAILLAKLADALTVHNVVEITGIYKCMWGGEK